MSSSDGADFYQSFIFIRQVAVISFLSMAILVKRHNPVTFNYLNKTYNLRYFT